MTNKEKELINKLKLVCLFKNDNDYDEYPIIINQLKKNQSQDVLEGLLSCFNDIEAGEIQYELVEACEEYDSEIYIPTLLNLSEKIKKDSPEWFELLFYSILNTEEDHQILFKAFEKLDNNKKVFIHSLVKNIVSEDMDYKFIFERLNLLM